MTTRASILIVDDSPEKVMALETVLEGLAEDVVTARSGRDALRQVLSREFAVILLDVRMPDIDGFETAQLIRQRESSQHTPIIFITAFGEDEVQSRGYELGAVDFITTPVRREVLRSKVAVFLDLFKKARQISRQSESLKRQAARLHHLSRASLAINSALTIEEMLEVATVTSRELVGADEAATLAQLEASPPRLRCAASLREGLATDRRGALEEAAHFTSRLDPDRPVIVTAEELTSLPAWAPFREKVGPDRARLERLATPLTSRGGRNIGWMVVSAGPSRPFTAEDETILTQLAQVASIALENVLYSDAREANRLKDEFLTTLSHELRTPLTAMLGWVRILRTAPVGPEQLAHALAVIERNVTAQSRLIEDMLDVSRVMTGKLRLEVSEVRPVAVVDGVMEALAPNARASGVSMSVDVDPSIRPSDSMAADPERLAQVVWNLLSNALKFTPPRGHVETSIARVDGQLRLRVADDGRGIEPAFLKHAFDRFRQADSSTTRSRGGLGIGLALVKHIVELHGGTVTAESPGLGHGTTFTAVLPFAPPPRSGVRPGSGASWEAPLGPEPLGGVSILLVDDEPDAREVLGEVLRRAGATVATVGSAHDALDCFRASRTDVLVSDIGMAGVDGLSLIRSVRALFGDVPAIAVTAYARDEDRLLALSAGFQAHLSKPVEPADLVLAIRRAVRRPAGRASAADGFRGRPRHVTGRGRRVLLIEDDADIRNAMKELLELDGHSVEIAGSGGEGVEIAVRSLPEIGLVDIGLPEMDGHEVARRIRARLGDAPIFLIALTGYSGHAARTAALEAGFDAHVTKPVDPKRLRDLLEIGG